MWPQHRMDHSLLASVLQETRENTFPVSQSHAEEGLFLQKVSMKKMLVNPVTSEYASARPEESGDQADKPRPPHRAATAGCTPLEGFEAQPTAQFPSCFHTLPDAQSLRLGTCQPQEAKASGAFLLNTQPALFSQEEGPELLLCNRPPLRPLPAQEHLWEPRCAGCSSSVTEGSIQGESRGSSDRQDS